MKACKREIKESTAKPPDNDDFTDIPTSTEGGLQPSKANDSSLMLSIIIVMTLLLLLVMSAIICKFYLCCCLN